MFKSNNLSLWPVLLMLNELTFSERYVVINILITYVFDT